MGVGQGLGRGVGVGVGQGGGWAGVGRGSWRDWVREIWAGVGSWAAAGRGSWTRGLGGTRDKDRHCLSGRSPHVDRK